MNYPPPYQPGPPRRTRWLWVALTIAVVVIAVLAGVVIWQLTGKKSGPPTNAATPQPSTVQPAPQSSGARQPSMTCEGYTASLDAQSPPGWQPTVGSRGLAYAVPPTWTVQPCGGRLGWQKPCLNGAQGVCPIRAMGAAASLRSPSCGDSNIAMAGVAGSKATDLNTALAEETTTVPIIYTSNDGQEPKVSLGPVRPFMIGPHQAVQQVATVTDIAQDPCTGTSALHSMVATTVPNVAGTVVFIISLKQDTPGAPGPDVIDKIVATLRSPA